MLLRRYLACLTVLLIITLQGCSGEQQPVFLEDSANLLDDSERTHLTAYNKVLLRDLDIHFKLIISDRNLVDINSEAARLFGTLGEATKGAKGLLFLVDPKGEQVRIEVGYDLEEIFPDIFVGYVEQYQMVPFFKAGKIGAGIEATTELLVARVQEAIQGNRFDPEKELPDLAYFSGGGGARIDTSPDNSTTTQTQSPDRLLFQPGTTPEETLQVYMQALQLRIKDPELPLFTKETQAFFANWTVTDAQQENELRSFQGAPAHETRVSGMYGVIRYPVADRTYAPYFFRKGNKGWLLDFSTMSKVLQMNHKNMWRMRETTHPYMFAFKDWLFDENGFPVKNR